MINNLTVKEILNDADIKQKFLNAKIEKLNIIGNIYNGNFFSDSFNYFPISDQFHTFGELFSRDTNQSNNQFFSKNFYENFKKNISNLKSFKNVFLMGSNAGNNYYSNLIQFLPRIFFNSEKNIKIAIHRNSSLKFRKFLESVLKKNNIKFSYVYLDDNFYSFIDSQFPQFLNISSSIKILRHFLIPKSSLKKEKKIYVTREDSSYRQIVNESDLVPILISKGYKVINPQLYNIDDQIEIFSQVDKIVAPHGSNLANIVFCKPGTEIYEIGPEFKSSYELSIANRYKYIADLNKLKYIKILSDTVKTKKHSELAKKYINKNILEKSSYYKNLIVKIDDLRNIP